MLLRYPIIQGLALISVLLPAYGYAATSPDQILRDRQQQLEQQRQELLTRPDIFNAPIPEAALPAPQDSMQPQTEIGLCFEIKSVTFTGEPTAWDGWLHDIVKPMHGNCPDVRQLQTLVQVLTNAMVERGYVTSRAYLPEQNLKSGVLKLVIVPGRLGQIRLQNGGSDLSLRAAFPIDSGDVLNVRALEQGLEQLSRVSSQKASMEIVPAGQEGYSDVLVKRERGKPWSLTYGWDDSGQKSTGKQQGSLGLTTDNVIGINDSFSINWTQDGERISDPRSRADTLSWVLPWGNWTGLISYSESDYRQLVQGVNQTFISTGHSRNSFFSLSRLLQRNQASKTELALQLTRKASRSFIENVEISTQRRNLTQIGLELTHRHYLGAWVLDGALSATKGISFWDAMADTLADQGGPSARARVYAVRLNLSAPLKIGEQNLRWTTSIKGQYSPDLLLGSEQFSIGSRYTVRGFDTYSLSGSNGYFLRNELAWTVLPPSSRGQSLEVYTGLDLGQVSRQTYDWGASTLSGWGIGLRASLYPGLNLELAHERALYQPEGWNRPAITHFRVAMQY